MPNSPDLSWVQFDSFSKTNKTHPVEAADNIKVLNSGFILEYGSLGYQLYQ